MATNRTRNVIFIDAPDAGSAWISAGTVPQLGGVGVEVRIGGILIVHGAAAAARVTLYGAQAATAGKQIFDSTSPLSGVAPTAIGSDYFPFFPAPDQGILFSDN